MHSELPNFISILADKFKGLNFIHNLYLWENVVFSLIIICCLSAAAYLASRKISLIPNRLQNIAEGTVEVLDNFVTGILGSKGRKFTPFIGTLFIYILFANLLGLMPFMKSPTSSLSITFALALCVFVYIQFTAIKELGFLGYLDHLSGKPRGMLAFSIVIPIVMFFVHIVTELFRPITLSMRLRSNIWGDDILLAVLAGFGIKGLPLLFINMLTSLLTAIVQAVVFCLLTTVYFALILAHDEPYDSAHGKTI